MTKLLKKLTVFCVSGLVVGLLIFSYYGYQSYRALTYMKNDLYWLWVDSQLISPDTTAMQSGRTPHTKQLVYRQVDVNRQMAVFLNTTYNGYFLFTFVKSAPCSASSSYDAMLTVNGEADQPVSFQCQTPNTAIYRIAEPKFTQLKLVNSDFSFDISEQKWPFKALKKDDFMQRNYHFFKGRTKEPLYPWNRD